MLLLLFAPQGGSPRTISASVSTSTGNTATLVRGTAKRVLASLAQAVTRSAVGSKLFLISQAEAVTRRLLVLKRLLATQGETVTRQSPVSKVLLVSQAEAVSRVSAAGKRLLLVQAQAIFLARNLVRVVLLSQAQLITRVSSVAKLLLSLAQGQLVTLTANPGKLKLLTITQAQLVQLLRAPTSRLVLVPGPAQLVLLARAPGKLVRASTPNALVLAFLRQKFAGIVQAQSLLVRRNLGKLVGLSQVQAIFANGLSAGVIRLSMPQALTLRRGAAKALLTSLGTALVLTKGRFKAFVLPQGELVSLLRGRFEQLAALQGQTLRRFVGVQKGLAASLSVVAVLRTGLGRTVPLLQGSALSALRAVQKLMAFGQSLSSRLVLVHPVQLLFQIGQVVTIPRASPSQLISVASGQAVLLVRTVGKMLKWSMAQLLTLHPGSNARRLLPSMFAWGLFRKRLVFDVPNFNRPSILSPATEPFIEIEDIVFDFGLTFEDNTQITSASVSVTVFSGNDAVPEHILVEPAVIVSSIKTRKVLQAVRQRVGNANSNTVYRIQCVATTSPGKTKALATLFSSEASF